MARCWLARHGEEKPQQLLQRLWQYSRKAKAGRKSPETEAQSRFIKAWKAGE